jgi:hypothetical protein
MKMNKINLLLGFLLIFLFINCATSVGYVNEGVEYPPSTMESIKLYSDKVPERNYVEIGYVSAHITDNPSGDGLKELLKKEASKMGADAIISFQLWGATAEGIAIKFEEQK